MANAQRGEIELTIGKDHFTLCPTFQALCEFETKAGITVFEAASNMAQAKMSASVMVSAAWAGIRGGMPAGTEDQAPSWLSVGQRMQSAGLTNFLQPIFQFLTNALASDDDIREQEERLGNENSEDSTTTLAPSE